MKLEETLNFLNSKTNNFKPEIAVILGSGLGCFTDGLEGITVKYSDIPNFGTSNVQGHKGEFLFCTVENKNCAIMQGRFHFYEGNSLESATYPIKVLKKMGIKTLIITNAAGSLRSEYNIGDIMMIKDHINFMGSNPLIGKNDDSLGVRFPDMSDIYTESKWDLVRNCAKNLNIDLKEGIYIATTGPSYETKAEIKAYKLLGADAVGMSTAPEAIVASYLKTDVIAFSLLTNYAAGIAKTKLNHEEVLNTGKTAGLKLSALVKEIIKNL